MKRTLILMVLAAGIMAVAGSCKKEMNTGNEGGDGNGNGNGNGEVTYKCELGFKDAPEGNVYEVKPGEEMQIAITVSDMETVSVSEVPEKWTAVISADTTSVAVTPDAAATEGNYVLKLAGKGKDGKDYEASCTMKVNAPGVLEFKADEDGDMKYELPQNATANIKFTMSGMQNLKVSDMPQGWTATINEQDTVVTVTAPFLENGNLDRMTLTITGEDSSNETLSSTVEVNTFPYDAAGGAFILNEGNMTTENGSMTYITPEGKAYTDVYFTSNGTHLGNVAQDMFIHQGEIYVISQNGSTSATGSQFENDGMLVVMDARTLRRTESFMSEELPDLSWPTHIAVLDKSHVYIRDNKGVWRFDRNAKSLTYVEGSDGMLKIRMAKVGDRICALANSSRLLPKIHVISADADATQTIDIWDFNSYSGLVAADDEHIWVAGKSGFGTGGRIAKINVSTKEKVYSERFDVEPASANNSSIAVKGNTVYFQNNMMIYSYDFDKLEMTSLVDMFDVDDRSNVMYNGVSVNPSTGDLYVTMLSDFATYEKNTTWVFNFVTGGNEPLRSYSDVTRFPAGVYFNDEF